MENSSSNTRAVILIAEDSLVEAELLRRILVKAGFKVVVTKNGQEALQALSQNPCSLVISDIQMPFKNGYELCREIKNDENLWNIPVILVSSLTEPEDIIMSLNVGADSYLTKPFDETHLLARIQSLLAIPVLRPRVTKRPSEQLEYNGKLYTITADIRQALNLLLSMHENSLAQNQELRKIQSQLNLNNKESEEKLRSLYELSPLGIALTDMNGHYLEFNESFRRICGYSESELKALDYWTLTPKKYEADEARQLEALANTGHYGPYEKEYVRKDGTHVPLCLNGLIVTGQDGHKYIWSIVEDISERKWAEKQLRKRAERELHASSRKYKLLFESSRDALMTLAPPSWKFSEANKTTLQMFGATSLEEFVTLGPASVSPERQPDGRPSSEKAQEMIGLSMRNGSHFFEWVHQRLDGQLFSADVLLTCMREGEQLFLMATVRDITERKLTDEALRREKDEQALLIKKLEEAQSHLLQSEKMASIGQLAAGVAHEINNPIGYVHSNLGTLEKYAQDTLDLLSIYEQAEGYITDSGLRATLKDAKEKLDIDFLKVDLRALIDESREGITRVKEIVQNLKDFSHVDDIDEWRFSNLHHGLDSTLNIVNNEIKYKANLVKRYGAIPEVECVLSRINQVFMNLLVNAAHAIEQRGTITISTGIQGDEVWVSIADTGKGIAPEHITKIFDPFFTTKPIGKGTGLGLSLSYSIIQKHHGRIEVESEVGKGSTFRVWLPIRQVQNAHE